MTAGRIASKRVRAAVLRSIDVTLLRCVRTRVPVPAAYARHHGLSNSSATWPLAGGKKAGRVAGLTLGHKRVTLKEVGEKRQEGGESHGKGLYHLHWHGWTGAVAQS